MESDMQVTPVLANDLTKIVEVHKEAFQGDLFSQLGDSLILQYYKEFYTNKETIFLKATAGGELVGFALVTPLYGPLLSAYYKKNFFKLLSQIAWGFLKFDVNIIAGVGKRVGALFNNHNQDIKLFVQKARNSLLSIAVRSDYQGKSVANHLLNGLEETMQSKGISCYKLSVSANNQRAKAFYKKMGFDRHVVADEKEYYLKRLCEASRGGRQ